MNKTHIEIEEKLNSKKYKEIVKQIEKYDKIAIFRHIMPDFDALGTQLGLAEWIKLNFPNKEVRILGDNHTVFTPRGLFPKMDELNNSWFNDKFLAIIVDVGDKKRIADPRFEQADYKIKMDHHPATDNIFNLDITDTSKAAAAEIIACFILGQANKFKYNDVVAKYLYIALVGDSGRFQYNSTTPLTFEVAGKLIETGINITKIYEMMYQKEIQDLETTKYILNTFKISKEGVAYYVFEEKEMAKLGLSCDRGKENVNLFSTIKGIKIWCSITEDVTEPCFRISIRSRNYTINGVATEFKGGGHAQAAGCQIKDLTELPAFIEALDNLIIKTDKEN